MACKNIVTERGGDMSVTRNGRCIYTNLTFRLQLEDNSSVDLVGDSQLELSTRSQLWSQTRRIGLELRHELDRSWTGVGVELATVKPPIELGFQLHHNLIKVKGQLSWWVCTNFALSWRTPLLCGTSVECIWSVWDNEKKRVKIYPACEWHCLLPSDYSILSLLHRLRMPMLSDIKKICITVSV